MPALNLTFSPRRRDSSCMFLVLRMTVRQIQSREFQSIGERFPLSRGRGPGRGRTCFPSLVTIVSPFSHADVRVKDVTELHVPAA